MPLELWTNYIWTNSDAVYTSGLATSKCFPQTSSEFGLTTKKKRPSYRNRNGNAGTDPVSGWKRHGVGTEPPPNRTGNGENQPGTGGTEPFEDSGIDKSIS